jgi:threonine dehydrogenase-like Zn-dependent dehydrogenase
MPGANCLPLPDDLDDDTAIAVFGCGIGVAYHGSRRLGVQAGETILVVGAGPIGLSAVLVLNRLGARAVVADVNPYRRELARALGAAACLAADDPQFSDALRAANDGRLADRAFLASGNPAACALALASIEPEGSVATVGGVGEFPLNTFGHLSVRDRALIGSWHYHRSEFDPLVEMTRNGLPAAKIITHRFPLEEAPEAYRLFAAGEAGKTLLSL